VIELYTRAKECPWCIRAKELLNEKHYEFKEIVVGEGISRDDFILKFWPNAKNPRPTVPRIMINDKIVGGFEELKEWLDANNEGRI